VAKCPHATPNQADQECERAEAEQCEETEPQRGDSDSGPWDDKQNRESYQNDVLRYGCDGWRFDLTLGCKERHHDEETEKDPEGTRELDPSVDDVIHIIYHYNITLYVFTANIPYIFPE
jgi:hypothetical protein